MRRAALPTLLCFALALFASMPETAAAQTMPTSSSDDLTATGKGIAGCGLLGGEAAFLIEAAAGVDATWAYIVFPLLGAGGGAVGGYFLENADQTSLSVASLALGVALIIPTIVITLSATSYDAEDDDEEAAHEDGTPSDADEAGEGAGASEERTLERSGEMPATGPTGEGVPAAGGGQGGDTTTPPPAEGGGGAGGPTSMRHHPRRQTLGLSLLNLADGGRLALGIPNITVSPLAPSRAELGLRAAGTEVRVSLLSVAF